MALNNEVVDIVDNLILKKDGSVFALYEVEAQVVNPVDVEKKENAKNLVVDWLENIKVYGDFDIVMLPFPKDLLGKFGKLSERFSKDTEDMAYSVLEKSYDYLMATKELCDYHYFISIPLKSFAISADVKEVIRSSLVSATDFLVENLGFQKNVLEGWEEKYIKQREVLEKDLDLLSTRRLETKETIFVNRYAYCHSLSVDKDYEVSLVENHVGNLGDKSVNFSKMNLLELHNEGESQFVAFLPVAYKPENASYLHTIEKARSLGFPVEVWTKAKFAKTKGLPFNNIRTKGRFARARLKNTETEAQEADSVGKKSVGQSKYLVEKMEEKIDDGIPMINYLQTMVVSDVDLQVLKQKINILMDAMKDIKVQLSRATPYQLYLFAKNRFGEILMSGDKNFIQPVEAGAFAEELFFTTQQVGEEVGFYLGMIDNQVKSWHSRYEEAVVASDKPVFLNILEANEHADGRDTNNPHIMISGDTGNGKTFAASMIHFYSSLLNAQTLYIDPKMEKRYWYEKMLRKLEETGRFPEIQDYIRSLHFVTLDYTKPENHGVLDPLVFLDKAQVKGLILSMIDEFMPLETEKKFKTELSKMIREFAERRAKGETVGTLSIFKALMKHEDEKVRETAELLVEEVTDSVLSLVFSDGRNPAVDLTARNTILEIANLDLPADEKAHLTYENHAALSVMYALGNYCIKFGERDYATKTVEFLDEAWIYKVTAYGRGLLDRIKRVGRSQNNFLVFISQEQDDSNREDGQVASFGSYFCFHNEAEGADEKVLRRLKVRVTEESKEWFNNMTKAQCLYKDTYGQVERITIDGLFFPEIAKLFETVRKPKEQEVA
ncbi:ATP-binding protein [Streptococcus constellatus]|uniref:ATP-binding protein n=1 Tax=Streptococcus constellatus TaxID=76860 RepID=UPI001898758C|nr:ATP-binding protein [Streptococcus constellatus]